MNFQTVHDEASSFTHDHCPPLARLGLYLTSYARAAA